MSAPKATRGGWTPGLQRIGQRVATSKTYAGWHEFAKAAKPYALFREDGDARLFDGAPDLVAALELLVACEGPHGALDIGMIREYLVGARAALAKARGEGKP